MIKINQKSLTELFFEFAENPKSKKIAFWCVKKGIMIEENQAHLLGLHLFYYEAAIKAGITTLQHEIATFKMLVQKINLLA